MVRRSDGADRPVDLYFASLVFSAECAASTALCRPVPARVPAPTGDRGDANPIHSVGAIAQKWAPASALSRAQPCAAAAASHLGHAGVGFAAYAGLERSRTGDSGLEFAEGCELRHTRGYTMN